MNFVFAFYARHIGPTNFYTAIEYPDLAADRAAVRPLFYGMWAFATATAQQTTLMQANISSTSPLLKAYALRDANGQWRAVLLHKDANATQTASACVRVPSDSASATVYRMAAPSPWSTDRVTFAQKMARRVVTARARRLCVMLAAPFASLCRRQARQLWW